jgi:hypothetical protein
MHYKAIDNHLKPLFQQLEETGIILDEEKLISLIRGSQKRLAEQKQAINREVGFMVNLYSADHWNRAIGEVGDSILLEQLLEARTLSSLIRKAQQVYDLANGNYRVLGRQFGLYPKYGLDFDRSIITISELSMGDLPEEVMGIVSYKGMILIKATYLDIVLSDLQKLSGDPWLIEATAMDLVKMGFTNLFEDYRIGKLGSQVFAIAPYSVYLFAPEEHIDLVSLIVRECLKCVHADFALNVDVTTGVSLDKLG